MVIGSAGDKSSVLLLRYGTFPLWCAWKDSLRTMERKSSPRKLEYMRNYWKESRIFLNLKRKNANKYHPEKLKTPYKPLEK